MRRLLLLRHAKAASPGAVADIDRPLSQRGRAAAALLGEHLAEQGLVPDLALVSSARRTRETFDLVRPALGDVPVRFEPRIYEAPSGRLLSLLHEVEPSVRTLLMVGHNPGFEDLARVLIGYGDRYALAHLSRKYPTAGLAVLDQAAESWRDLGPRLARLDRFVTPKSLGATEED